MASTQVLPSSRKQEHLEAGKRRLEQFRKKKVVERSRKAPTTNISQLDSSLNADLKDFLEIERSGSADSDGFNTSVSLDGAKELNLSNKNDFNMANVSDADAIPPKMDGHDPPSAYLMEGGNENHHNFFRGGFSQSNDNMVSSALEVEQEMPTCSIPDLKFRRSRPSFIDSLNLSRASLGNNLLRSRSEGILQPDALQADEERGFSFLNTISPSTSNAADHSLEAVASSDSVLAKGIPILNVGQNNFIKNGEHFFSSKDDGDFVALEQHIEDLTREKFSLQRALEVASALSESLATENSSLTDNYNQQRSAVEQLNSDVERLHDEIKDRLVELESVKNEYANALLECNAADERSKLLAADVIGLEEKALKLRSNELKLERQLQESHEEIRKYIKKMSSLEKEQRDMQSTVNALYEEKKLLQANLRKASTRKSIDAYSDINIRKDISTTTEDLDVFFETSNAEAPEITSSGTSNAPGPPIHPQNEEPDHDVSAICIPPEHGRLIQNIHAHISELASERRELLQALSSESSQCSKLKEFNKELLSKLEAQSQRIGLLSTKSMVVSNAPSRFVDSQTMPDHIAYADEGDEVVERVLGWIMKIFPRGASRRPSKLL